MKSEYWMNKPIEQSMEDGKKLLTYLEHLYNNNIPDICINIIDFNELLMVYAFDELEVFSNRELLMKGEYAKYKGKVLIKVSKLELPGWWKNE
jgi:hypothetical protein